MLEPGNCAASDETTTALDWCPHTIETELSSHDTAEEVRLELLAQFLQSDKDMDAV